MGSVRVFVLEDHQLVRDAFRHFFSMEQDIELVGEADTAATGYDGILATSPDVAIVDVNLPDGNGIEVCRELRDICPDVRFLIVTGSAGNSVADAVMAGAAGYVTKGLGIGDLVDVVRRVARGEGMLDGKAAQIVLERMRSAPSHAGSNNPSELTEQETKILDLIGKGLTNREIAGELGLAEQTVKNYVSNLLAKLGLKRRTQAAVFAARRHEGSPSPVIDLT